MTIAHTIADLSNFSRSQVVRKTVTTSSGGIVAAQHRVAAMAGAAALAAAKGMQDWKAHKLAVRSLQEYHQGVSLSALEPSDGGASN